MIGNTAANNKMHQETLKEIVSELNELLPGRFLGRVFQLSPASIAIDFHLRQDGLLFISVEPAAPRLHLMKRSVRELERRTLSPSPFVQALRAALSDAAVASVTKDEVERIVRFHFSAPSEDVNRPLTTMVAQLTGRSANLFLLDGEQKIVHALRRPRGEGQQVSEKYRPPPQSPASISREPIIPRGSFPSLSEAVDKYYGLVEVEDEFKHAAATLKDQLRREIAKRKKLLTSLQDAAAEAFSRYGKAKRAVEEIKGRLIQVNKEIEELNEKQAKLVAAIAKGDKTVLAQFVAGKQKTTAQGKTKGAKSIPGTRRYRSSDGYEVVVGRTARDNDNLTFRVARPNDLWLHAGDYPGSHVIVRNASRREIPQRTVIEAAQLAARFSQASNDSKVIIHYTPRKFLSKPKGSAPGLVRMSSFKTIAVEPAEDIERIL